MTLIRLSWLLFAFSNGQIHFGYPVWHIQLNWKYNYDVQVFSSKYRNANSDNSITGDKNFHLQQLEIVIVLNVFYAWKLSLSVRKYMCVGRQLQVGALDVLLIKVSMTDGRRLILHYILGICHFVKADILKTIRNGG